MSNSGLENVVWLSVAGSVAGIIGLTVRAILRSNCKEFVCCFGLIKCFRFERDVYKTHDIEAAISHHKVDKNNTVEVDDIEAVIRQSRASKSNTVDINDIEAVIKHSRASKSNKTNQDNLDDLTMQIPKIIIPKSKLESQSSMTSMDTPTSEWNVKL